MQYDSAFKDLDDSAINQMACSVFKTPNENYCENWNVTGKLLESNKKIVDLSNGNVSTTCYGDIYKVAPSGNFLRDITEACLVWKTVNKIPSGFKITKAFQITATEE